MRLHSLAQIFLIPHFTGALEQGIHNEISVCVPGVGRIYRCVSFRSLFAHKIQFLFRRMDLQHVVVAHG